jgi:hypothetical protein
VSALVFTVVVVEHMAGEIFVARLEVLTAECLRRIVRGTTPRAYFPQDVFRTRANLTAACSQLDPTHPTYLALEDAVSVVMADRATQISTRALNSGSSCIVQQDTYQKDKFMVTPTEEEVGFRPLFTFSGVILWA